MIKSVKIQNIYTDKLLLEVTSEEGEIEFKSDGSFDSIMVTKDSVVTMYNFPSDKVYNSICSEK